MTGWRDAMGVLQEGARGEGAFGEAIEYEPDGLAKVTKAANGVDLLTGIYRDPHVAVDVEMEVEIESTAPTLDVELVDLPAAPTRKDFVTVLRLARRFSVSSSQEDGEGMTKLFLHDAVAAP